MADTLAFAYFRDEQEIAQYFALRCQPRQPCIPSIVVDVADLDGRSIIKVATKVDPDIPPGFFLLAIPGHPRKFLPVMPGVPEAPV